MIHKESRKNSSSPQCEYMISTSLSKIYISTQLNCDGETPTPLEYRQLNLSHHTLQDKNLIPEEVTALLELDEQKAIPSISKNEMLMEKIQQTVQSLPSSHQLLVGDSK